MAKKEDKGEKATEEKDTEQLKEEIAQKGKEIEHLKQSVDEMKKQINEKEKKGETADLGVMLNDVSGLLDASFRIFGISNEAKKVQGEKSKGLIEIVNDLAKLTEKSETYQKRINIGKGGVIDVNVSSRPIRQPHATAPSSGLNISRPNRGVSKMRTTLPSTVESIKEREPIVDVFEEDDYLRVMAELPGVEENAIKFEVTGNNFTISTDTSTRSYYKKVELPTPVEKNVIESRYRNGILEVKLRKTKKD